ncbi:acyltransferase [Micromonospora sp. NBC_01699]|uniref:acyltransferase family protein n=1 Tax=Micromonospora sp. NBC_01699 TaxID=2975984 RepID=UPI002E30348B|nr:acyltransferase [Micromonospora sp. NBC_01699]
MSRNARIVERDTPTAAIARDPPGYRRSRYLDLWRAIALVRVVVYHALGWIWVSVSFPAMGLMFGLAGSLMASSLDRSGSTAVGRRLRRLLPPLWAFGTITVVLLLSNGWRAVPSGPLGWAALTLWAFPVQVPPVGGPAWSWAFNITLWYVVTYLWLMLLSPALLALFRRWPYASLAAACCLSVGFQVFGENVPGYFIAGYLPCWLLGFAHHDGLLHRIAARRYACGVAALATSGIAWVVVAAWRDGEFDLDRIPSGNVLWTMAVVATVLRFRPRLDWLARIRPLDRMLQAVNARAVTIYLWHVPVGMLVATVLVSTGRVEPGWQAAVRLAGVLALTALAVVLLGWIEDLAARRPATLFPRDPTVRRPATHRAASGQRRRTESRSVAS